MSRAYYIFTLVIDGIEFHSEKMEEMQAEAMRLVLEEMHLEWAELEMGE